MNEAISQIEEVKPELLEKIPEIRELQSIRSRFLEVALSVTVIDQLTLKLGNQLFVEAGERIKEVDDRMEKSRKAAHTAWKEIVALIEEMKEPYLKAKIYLNDQVTAYKREQDRIRAEEEDKLLLEAIRIEAEKRQKEETERLEKAAILEAAGAKEEAEALVQEAIEEKEKPIEVYIPPPVTPKVELEGASVKTYWSAEVTDLRALCKAVGDGECPLSYIEANMTVLNAQARSLKKEMAIPGVKAVSTTSMAATGKR